MRRECPSRREKRKERMSEVNKKFVSLVSIAIILFSLVAFVPVGGAGASGAKKLTILHTNDDHSCVIPWNPAIDYTPAVGDDPTVGGFARRATQIDRIKAAKALQGEPVLTFDVGDFLMETMFSWLGGVGLTPELTLMQNMGYDAVTLGNHEYDWGPNYLASYLSAAGYPNASAFMPIVASNVNLTGHPLETMGIAPYIVKTLSNGLKVGIFGIIGSDAISDVVQAAPVTFADPKKTAANMVSVLKALNVNLIIELSHSGVTEDVDMAKAVPGIDIIVGGHSHTALFQPVVVPTTVGKTIIVQAGAEGMYLGELELSVWNGEVSIRNYDTGNPFLIPIDDWIPASTSIQTSIDNVYVPALNEMVYNLTGGEFHSILDTVAESNFSLIHLPFPSLFDTGVGNLITDSMRNMTSAQFAFEANGLIRGTVPRGSMPGKKGLISLYDLYLADGCGTGPDGRPGNPVVCIYLTAEEIRRVCEICVTLSKWVSGEYFLQVSGMRFKYNATLIGTYHAVREIEQWNGSAYLPFYENGMWFNSTNLYKLAGDLYIVYFLPRIASELPQLTIIPKNQTGYPISDPTKAIVYQAPGIELKIWQALLYYVVHFPDINGNGIPDVPPLYAGPAGRILPIGARIYIRPDGSVYPSTAPISRAGNVYTFTANIYEPIVIQTDNITVNGNGYMLQGVPSSYGFNLTGRSRVTIKNTYITGFHYGIFLKSSFNCTIDSNAFTQCDGGGFWEESSTGNNITRNAMANNYVGILLTFSNNTNTITGNSIRNNPFGIMLTVSSNNTIRDNTVANNTLGGVYLDRANNNLIYHNNLLYNTPQAVTSNSTNTWDNGYPSGGNYWSDYKARYPSAAEIDSSGIWNTSYVIDANNTDRYPLMSIQGIHDMAVTSLTISKTLIGEGYPPETISVTVQNQGSSTEAFDIIVYANSSIIQTLSTYLTSGSSTTRTITWTGWTIGSYNFKASVTIVPGETNTANNNYTDGWVKVYRGDVNGDGKVSLADFGKLKLIYSKVYPYKNPPYDVNDPDTYYYLNSTVTGKPEYLMPDINCDGKVSFADVGLEKLIYSAKP
jgi:5'-nucleotidase/UDP-sugar diphosphatase